MHKITTITRYHQMPHSQMQQAQVLDKAIRQNLEVLSYGK